jgi:hypothetical protein
MVSRFNSEQLTDPPKRRPSSSPAVHHLTNGW